MINMLSGAPVLWLSVTAVLLAAANPAFSQAPTDAQRSAIRSECRSDYQANCSSVPPGGMASLQCLQKNMSNLSPGCQAAVRAVGAPAEPKAESAPPAAAPKESVAKPAAETAAPAAPKETAKEAPKETPKAAASTATRKPSSSQIAAVRSACRSDYQKVCAGVPTGGPAALQCLEKNKANLSAACQRAVSAATGIAVPAVAGAPPDAATVTPAATPAAPPPPVLVLRPMRPREVLFVLRSACGGDVRTLCAGVPPGGGRIIECLATQAASLSPSCTEVLSQFSAQ
jgi:hypothetical protein